jgi:hypothetical protein
VIEATKLIIDIFTTILLLPLKYWYNLNQPISLVVIKDNVLLTKFHYLSNDVIKLLQNDISERYIKLLVEFFHQMWLII